MFNILKELDSDLLESYRYLDLLQLHRNPIGAVPSESLQRSAKLKKAQETLKKAETQNTKALAGKDAKRKEKAAQDLASAQEALAEESAAAHGFIAWAEDLFPKIAELTEGSSQETEQTPQDQETLEKLKPWVWNPDADIGFLRALSGNPLGDFNLERLLTLEGRPTANLLPEPQLKESKVLRLQTLLWTTGSMGEAEFDSDTYYPYGYEITESALDLIRDDPATVLFEEGTLQASVETIAALETVRTQGLESVDLLQTAIKNLQGRIRARLRIRMYQYDSETTQDRRELSDVYIRLDRNDEAIRMLKRVLVAAPSDAASLFTLGRAYEMGGDWSSAMEKYQSVYELNPRFESAVASYNRLARLHGKTWDTSVSIGADAQRTNVAVRLAYAVPINGILDVQASYTMENLKIHAPQGGSLPESIQLHTADISVPITLPSLGLQVYFRAGGTVQNKLSNLLPPRVKDFSPEKTTEYVVTAPRIGGGAVWKKGIFTLNGTYGFNQAGETFFPDRFVHYEHAAGASGSAYYEAPFRNWGRILSAQVSFAGSSRFSPYFPNQENLIAKADGEIRVGNFIAGKPWTILDAGGLVSWQDSQKTSIRDYYSPKALLILKGGPTLSSRFGLGDGWEMTATARYWPGYYSPEQKGRFMWDALGRVDFVKKETQLYASVDVSRTDSLGQDPAYWSMSIGMGARIVLADYIIP
jgi:tetratricopeptide (TPR) repeat protein